MALSVVSPEDISERMREVNRTLIPKAIAAGIIPPGTSGSALLSMAIAEGDVCVDIERAGGSPKLIARAYLMLIVTSLASARAAHADDPAETDPEWRWSLIFGRASLLMTHAFGYISALADQNQYRVKAAAAKRRQQGEAKRQRVLEESAPFVGSGKSRSYAAEVIGPKVGLAPEKVRQLLSTLHPGASWDDSA